MWPFNLRRKSAEFIDVSVLLDLLEKAQAQVLASYEAAAENGFKKNGVVFRSLKLIGQGVGGVPVNLYRRTATGMDQLPSSHPMLRLLERPNPKDLTRAQFMMRIVLHLYLGGQVALYKVRRSEVTEGTENIVVPTTPPDQPIALWTLFPERLKLVNPNDKTKGYHYGGNTTRVYPYRDIRFLRLLNPTDEGTGFAPVNAASYSIAQGNNSRIWNNNLLANGCRPPGILTSEVPIEDPEERKRIIDTFMAKYAGSQNAGMPMLGGSIEFKPFGYTPQEMDYLKGQQVADRTTAFTLGVPSQLLGDKDAATYANMETARRALYEDEIVPEANWIYAEHSEWLAEDFGDAALVYVPDWDQVPALQENRTETWTRVKDADCLSVNEKREQLGYDEVPGEGGKLILTTRGVVITGDGRFFMPATLMEVDATGKPVEPEPEPKPKPEPPEEEEEDEEEEEEGEPKAAPDLLEIPASPWSLVSEEQKVAYWRAFDRKREPYVRVARRLVYAEFSKERRAVVAAIRRALAPSMVMSYVSSAVAHGYDGWLDTYAKLYIVVGYPFFRDVYLSLPKGLTPPLVLKADEDGIEDLWAEDVAASLHSIAPGKIKGLARTTLKQLQDALAEGEAAGESITQLATRIDKLYLRQIIPNRSEVIARTETCNSSNMASHEAAKATGVARRKMWISTRDDRARFDHWNAETGGADGQKVRMEEPFTVGGTKMMWPGDPSLGAPPDQVIQCRCTLGFETSI